MKVLVLKRDKIGDMLLAQPMLAHLKRERPDIELHLLANDYNAWVVEDEPAIDRLWVYPRFRHGASVRAGALLHQLAMNVRLRGERFDWAIAAGGVNSPRAIRRITRLGGARTIAYCDSGPGRAALSHALPMPPATHEVDLNLRLLAPLGIEPPRETLYPQYSLPASAQQSARSWLAGRGLVPRGYVVIGLNARRVKRKPTALQVLRWSQWLMHACALDTVLLWQPGAAEERVYPGDDEAVRPILERGLGYLHPFRFAGSMLPALGIVWNAALSIFPDGGIAHFAAASPGGVLTLFAETDVSPHPDQWGPRSRRGVFLEAAKSVAELADERIYEGVCRLLDQDFSR